MLRGKLDDKKNEKCVYIYTTITHQSTKPIPKRNVFNELEM